MVQTGKPAPFLNNNEKRINHAALATKAMIPVTSAEGVSEADLNDVFIGRYMDKIIKPSAITPAIIECSNEVVKPVSLIKVE